MKSAELKTKSELLKFRIRLVFLGFITCFILMILLIVVFDWQVYHRSDQFSDLAHFYSCIAADDHGMARGQLLTPVIQKCAGYAHFLQNEQVSRTYNHLLKSPIYSILTVFSILGLALTGKGKSDDR